MKYLHIAALLCASLFVVSCASMQPKLQEVHVPPERIFQKGYSLVPLNETGWFVVGRNASQLALGKRSENPDESFVIQTSLVKIGPYKTSDDFIRLVKEGETKSTDRQRYKIIQHDVSLYNEKGTDCAESHSVLEDNAAARPSGNTGVMILEILGLACAHPKDKTVVVNVGYSQRYYPGHRDTAFFEKATTLLNSLEFTDP